MRVVGLGWMVGLLVGMLSTVLAAADRYEFHQVQVLGTHMDLWVLADSKSDAERAEALALSEFDRLAKIVSTYDAQSELSAWMEKREYQEVSPELRDLLQINEHWSQQSGGVFHPGVESLSRIWITAEENQRLPDAKSLQVAVEGLQSIGWEWNADRTQVRFQGSHLTFNAIAKGWMIDRVCDALNRTGKYEGGLLAIGGDMRAFGTMHRDIAIKRPANDLASPTMTRVSLHQQAMATSSGAFRGFTIQGKWYSHLLDPRSGQPAEGIKGVSVLASSAAEADVLATIASVLTVQQSLALIDATSDAACLILDRNDQVHCSSRWPASSSFKYVQKDSAPQDWNGGMELKVDFQIHQEGSSGRYRRPYVAVWIEDKDNFPVRTLVLWAQTSGPGPRWIPDLKRWYKSDRLRKLADDTDLIDTVAEATRKPGNYTVIWNGEDDHKKLVKPGEYTLYIEAAREHGTYQLMRKKIEIGEKGFQAKLDDNAEIHGAKLEYHKREKVQ
ncbi:MAG: DUF2271 domain-containing protein [Pirellulales bacterium]